MAKESCLCYSIDIRTKVYQVIVGTNGKREGIAERILKLLFTAEGEKIWIEF